ncbi:MAG TPA: hypothetical protein PK156_13960, partial [Polyangium sp.]|nr:hypothetical protein [Polyangium sp.]
AIDSAIAPIREYAGQLPKDAFFLGEIARCHWIRAMYAHRHDQDASVHIDAARKAAQTIVAVRGNMTLATRILLARIELESLWNHLRAKSKNQVDYDTLFNLIRPVVEQKSDEAVIYEIMAEAYALRAAMDDGHTQDTAVGLRLMDDALKKNPSLLQPVAIQSLLHLVDAKKAKDRAASDTSMQQSTNAFAEISRRDKLVALDYDYRRNALLRFFQ